MSFPIAVQVGPSSEDFRPEIDLVAELTGSVLDLGSSLLARFRKAKAKSVAAVEFGNAGSKPALTARTELSEAQRLRIAQNPETPAAVLLKLSADSNSAVRNALVFNPAVPASVLFMLASDADRFVSAQARARISMAA